MMAEVVMLYVGMQMGQVRNKIMNSPDLVLISASGLELYMVQIRFSVHVICSE